MNDKHNNSVAANTNKRKYTKRLNETPGKISYYKLRVPNAKIERVYKLGDALSVTHNPETSKADESWDVKLFRPSIRPDNSIRFRTQLIVQTEHDSYHKAHKVAELISKQYGIPYTAGIEHGTELNLSHTKRTIRSESSVEKKVV
jgi:hypothetical protein